MDEALRAELLEMERVDRAVRADLVARGELHRPGYHPQMEAVHRRHNARMRAIINAHGWPGYSLAGADGCCAAGFLVQHAILDHALQRECLERLRQVVEAGEAAPFMLALLTDRVLMDEGQPQVYGTQYLGAAGGDIAPSFITDPATVDERRRAVGFPSLAQSTTRLMARHAHETARGDA
jgi:hypothetical protein